jgi:16S rRNA (guanine(966)-N(2))-methyltransferase RsmD
MQTRAGKGKLMPNNRRGRDLNEWKTNRPAAVGGKLRIVGGKYRGRQIGYSGDPVTRPMKDYTREAIFNLVGGWVAGKACFDLFAGTGAVGIEAISRGAQQAFLIERHFPTVKIIKENVELIDPEMNVQVEGADSFYWTRQFLLHPEHWPTIPWIVFICPPYALFVDRRTELLEMISGMLSAAPSDSILVVESDEAFDLELLPQFASWESRQYSPAVVSVFKKKPKLDA